MLIHFLMVLKSFFKILVTSRNLFFNPRKNPGKVRENPEKISEKSMYIFGEVRKISHDQLSRVRRRFRVVVSGPYWAAVRSMECDLYSLGSPAVGSAWS